MATAIQWDESVVIDGIRVRTTYFQDSVLSETLTDYDNKRMVLQDSGGYHPIANAVRRGRSWNVRVYERRGINEQRRVLDRVEIQSFSTKSEAIDFMVASDQVHPSPTI